MYNRPVIITIYLCFIVQFGLSCCTKKLREERSPAKAASQGPQSTTQKQIYAKYSITEKTGNILTWNDTSVEYLYYNIGETFRAECYTFNKDYQLLWYHAGANYSEKIPICLQKRTCLLEFELELFDNDTEVICVCKQKDVFIKSTKVVIRLKDPNIDISKQTSTETIYPLPSVGILYECADHKQNSIIGIHNPNLISYNLSSYSFENNEYINGRRHFCLYYSMASTSTSSIMTRHINNYFLYTTDATYYGRKNSESLIPFICMITGAIVVLCIVTALVVKLVMKCKQKQPSSEAKVVYADLEMLQAKSITFRGRNNTTPYAEVIGVLAPKTTSS